MNSNQNNKSQDQDTEKLKEIPKWAKRYAQNRTLTVLVLMVMITLFSILFGAVFGFLIVLPVAGFAKGNIALGCISTVVLIILSIAVVKFYISFLKKFGGKNRGLIDQIIERRIYGKEGAVSIPPPVVTKKMRGFDYILGAIGLIYMLGVNQLCMVGYIAFKYQQPLLALYFVPAFVFEYFLLQWPKVGPIALLWPTLYAIHAILIVAGVPIYFTGNLGILNMPVPLIGYGFLAYMIGHLYSRYALKKLKSITHLEGASADGN